MYCFCCFTLNFVNHLSKLCGPSSAAPPHGDTLHSHFILWQSDHCSNRLDANRISVYALKMEAIKLMPRALFFPPLYCCLSKISLSQQLYDFSGTQNYVLRSEILTTHIEARIERKNEAVEQGNETAVKDHSTAGVCWQEFPLQNLQPFKWLYYYWCFFLIMLTRNWKKKNEVFETQRNKL